MLVIAAAATAEKAPLVRDPVENELNTADSRN